jgi:hypothetical protein
MAAGLQGMIRITWIRQNFRVVRQSPAAILRRQVALAAGQGMRRSNIFDTGMARKAVGVISRWFA